MNSLSTSSNTYSCTCPLEDGRLLTLKASLRAANGPAAIKCKVAGADPGWQFTQQVLQVLQLARLHENPVSNPNVGHNTAAAQQLVLELDCAAPQQRNWELAVIVLDRLARGVYSTPRSHANKQMLIAGQVDDWSNGRLQPAQNVQQAALAAWLGVQAGQITSILATGSSADLPAHNSHFISSLAELQNNAGNVIPLRQQRAYFPLVGAGTHDQLSWLDLYQRALPSAQPAAEVVVLGLDQVQQGQVLDVLLAARSNEIKPVTRWQTVAHFAPTSFVGDSWQLALVLADRISRGRAFAPRARLIATGCSSRWQDGIVETVGAVEQKTQLLLEQVQAGDRIVLPAAWQAQIAATWLQDFKAKGANCVFVAQLGLW